MYLVLPPRTVSDIRASHNPRGGRWEFGCRSRWCRAAMQCGFMRTVPRTFPTQAQGANDFNYLLPDSSQQHFKLQSEPVRAAEKSTRICFTTGRWKPLASRREVRFDAVISDALKWPEDRLWLDAASSSLTPLYRTPFMHKEDGRCCWIHL